MTPWALGPEVPQIRYRHDRTVALPHLGMVLPCPSAFRTGSLDQQKRKLSKRPCASSHGIRQVIDQS